MLMWGIAVLGIGFLAGLWAGKKYFGKGSVEMTTEDCVSFLKERGYWVRLNVGPDSKIYK